MSSGRRRGHYAMTIETVQASTLIAAPAEAVFAVLADPASDLLAAGPGHRGRRDAAVRRLDLALRSGRRRTVPHRGHAHLRLYRGTAVPTRAHHVPAVPRGPPHQLAAPPGRAGPTGRRRRHFGSRSQSTWGIAARGRIFEVVDEHLK